MAAYRRVNDLVTCGLTTCTPGSAPGPTLDNEYEKLLSFLPDNVGNGVVFLVFGTFVRSFVHHDRSCYHDIMNGLSNVDETYKEYSVVPTDDLIRF